MAIEEVDRRARSAIKDKEIVLIKAATPVVTGVAVPFMRRPRGTLIQVYMVSLWGMVLPYLGKRLEAVVT